MKFDKSTKIASDIIGDIINSELSPYVYSEACYVLLTEELADHVIRIYYDTDWENIDDIDLPEEIFTGEMDEEEWKSHIGKHIVVSQYGGPWDIHKAAAFDSGVRIDFPDYLMNSALYTFKDMMLNESDVNDCFFRLSSAVCAMLKDGVQADIIKKMVLLEYQNI